MAIENGVLDLSFLAAESLASDQYKFVVLASDNTVRRPDSASEIPAGILQNNPASGDVAVVRVQGVSKLVCNALLATGKILSAEYVSAADAGKGQDAGTNWKYARAIVLYPAAGAEDDVATVQLIGPFPLGTGTLIAQTTVSAVATAAATTYTAAQLLGGFITRSTLGGNRSDVTPLASEIIAAISQAGAGNSFEFTIRNITTQSETITVTANTGVTLSGTMTIGQNNSKRFLCVVDTSTEVTIYSLGTVVH